MTTMQEFRINYSLNQLLIKRKKKSQTKIVQKNRLTVKYKSKLNHNLRKMNKELVFQKIN